MAGDRVRIVAQLVEGHSAAHVWADKFEGSVGDIFDLQDRITESIVGAIEPSVRLTEIERARQKRPDRLDAYDLYLRAMPYVHANMPVDQALLLADRSYRGFENRRQLASYVGIAPTPHKSGTMDRDRGISRAGNPRARATLIQLAWLWLRYQPGSELAAWFRARVGALQGRTRRIAIVAIARKLLIALWRYVETGLIPAGITLRAELQASV